MAEPVSEAELIEAIELIGSSGAVLAVAVRDEQEGIPGVHVMIDGPGSELELLALLGSVTASLALHCPETPLASLIDLVTRAHATEPEPELPA